MLLLVGFLESQADEEYHRKKNEFTTRMLLFQISSILFLAVLVLAFTLIASAPRSRSSRRQNDLTHGAILLIPYGIHAYYVYHFELLVDIWNFDADS